MTASWTTEPRPTPRERGERGRAARSQAPRSSHAALDLADDRDPIALLQSQDPSRLAELVPVRYGRMVLSPFAFFRGAAVVMADDLASSPRSGLEAQLCGDAHLLNFGTFGSPERALVFDLNDFDETLPGPFEWDVKRLAASVEIAGRDRGFTSDERKRAVLASVRVYREAMHKFAGMRDLEVWYAHVDQGTVEAELRARGNGKLRRQVDRSVAKALRNDDMRAVEKLTHEVGGERKIVSQPPLIVPLADLLQAGSAGDIEAQIGDLFGRYRATLPRDRRRLLDGFRYVDLARKVVGVGSVGTRCWILLLQGRDEGDPVFLQIKEAQASVLEPVLGESEFANHAERVVEGQRLMQATSDIFLGWLHADAGMDARPGDFYVRRLRDWKSSVDVATITGRGLAAYAELCGWTVARAQARTGDRIAIAAYLGSGDRFDRALAAFASAYADVNERDHAALVRAAADGKVSAESV
jgi:uncharacterized protein (DUF2252 family)